MNESMEFLRQINWFLKPVADFLIYLFTTATGYYILIAFFLLYMFFGLVDAVRVRRLLHKNAGYSQNALGAIEIFYVMGKEIVNSILKILNNIPVLLGVLALFFFITGMSKGIDSLDTFLTNQKKIAELKSVYKQLDKRYKVAEIKINDVNALSNNTALEILYFDYATQKPIREKQELTIEGTDIYFDAIVLNFEYSEIAENSKKNIVIPYRIFSDRVAQSEGILLNLRDPNGVPYFFHRDSLDVYGMDVPTYQSHIQEMMSYATDAQKARKAGIRSAFGNAVHRKVQTGDEFTVWVEQTGGLVIKDKVQF